MPRLLGNTQRLYGGIRRAVPSRGKLSDSGFWATSSVLEQETPRDRVCIGIVMLQEEISSCGTWGKSALSRSTLAIP